MTFNLDNNHKQNIIVNFIYNTIMSSDTPGPDDIVATFQWLRMTSASSRMLLQFRKKVT